MDGRVSLRALQQTKDDGRKIAGVVARVYQIARILDGAGVDLVSVGDTVGVNLWGPANPSRHEGQTVTVAQAVRRGGHPCAGLRRLLLRSLQEGTDAVVQPTIRFVKEAGVDAGRNLRGVPPRKGISCLSGSLRCDRGLSQRGITDGVDLLVGG